jgi:hypothetical protein
MITVSARLIGLGYTRFMTSSKLSKPKKKDRERQEKIAKNIEKEKIQLSHPQGLERFKKIIKHIGKKPQ